MPSRNGLLKLGVVLALALSGALWCGAVFFDGRSERNAIAVLEAAGAHVAYLTHVNGTRTDIDVEPPRSRSWRETALNFVWPSDHKLDVTLYQPISAANWQELASLRRLGNLSVQVDAFTDDDVQSLGRLTQLEWLDLSVGGLTGEQLSHLSGLTRLRTLVWDANDAGDEVLAVLKKMQDLENLTLDGCRLTDTGLKQLSSLRNLRRLHIGVEAGGLTNAGVAALKRSLPNCDVQISGGE